MNPMENALGGRFASVAVWCLGTAFFLVWASPFFSWTTDDSFITYRFSENLAAGEGFVFNRGEPVEGFSNLSWMLILAMGSFVGIGPVVFSKILGALSLAGILAVADKIVRMADVSLMVRFFLSLVIACDTSLALYAFAGLETVFYGFLILVFTRLSLSQVVEQKDRLIPILMVSFAILMTRPEGVLYPAVFLLWGPWRAFEAKKKGAPLGLSRKHWVGLGCFLVAVVALLTARYAAFGEIVPNTYFAKPTGSFGREFPTGGIAYLDQAVKDLGYLWPLALLLYFFNLKRAELADYRFVLAGSIAPLVVFSFYAGGDWMPNSRFLVPVFPLVYLLGITILYETTAYFRGRRFHWLAGALGVMVVSVGLVHQYTSRRAVYQGRDRIPYDLMNAGQNASPLGLWLKERFGSSCILATKRIGVVPYYSGLRTLDLYGLIDTKIARFIHAGGSFQDRTVATQVRDSILEREPSLIILHSEGSSGFTPHGIQEELLLEDMGDGYLMIGDYDFSKTFTNRVYLRKDLVSFEVLTKLRDDFRRHFGGGREKTRVDADEAFPDLAGFPLACGGIRESIP